MTFFRDTGAYISSQDHGMLCLTAADSKTQGLLLSSAFLRSQTGLCLGRGEQVGSYLKMSKLVIPVRETPSRGGICDFAH